MQSKMSALLRYEWSSGIFIVGSDDSEQYVEGIKFTVVRSETGQCTGLLIEPSTIPDIDWVLESDIIMEKCVMVPSHNWLLTKQPLLHSGN